MKRSITFVFTLFSHNLKISVKNQNNRLFGFLFLSPIQKKFFHEIWWKLTFLMSQTRCYFLNSKYLLFPLILILYRKSNLIFNRKFSRQKSCLLKKSVLFSSVETSTFLMENVLRKCNKTKKLNFEKNFFNNTTKTTNKFCAIY